MSSSTNGGKAAEEASGQPNLGVIAQYIKDFSFENPNAPNSLMQPQQQPQIAIQINVNPNQLSNTDFEVELKVEGKAELDRHRAVRVRSQLCRRVPADQHPRRRISGRC